MHYTSTYTSPSGKRSACEYRGLTAGGMARIWFSDGASMTTPRATVSQYARPIGPVWPGDIKIADFHGVDSGPGGDPSLR